MSTAPVTDKTTIDDADRDSGWAVQKKSEGSAQTSIFQRLAGGGIVDEEDFAAAGGLSGWFGSLLQQGSGAEDVSEEGWSKDGPAWINALSNPQKRFLVSTVQALGESTGVTSAGRTGEARLVRAIRNRCGLDAVRAREAIDWVNGGASAGA